MSAWRQRANPRKIEHAFRPPATFVGWNFGAKLFVEVKPILVQPVRWELRRQPFHLGTHLIEGLTELALEVALDRLRVDQLAL